MKETCPRCGGTFEKTHHLQKYCNPTCHHETFTCTECGTTRKDYPGRRQCSTKCRNLAMAKRNRSDPEAQRQRGRLGGKVRGAQKKAEASGTGYVKILDQHVHRIVARAVLGRDLRPGEVVHHEDTNRQNNHPHNLIVFPSQSWHFKHHRLNHLMQDSCDCEGIRLKEVMPSETPWIPGSSSDAPAK